MLELARGVERIDVHHRIAGAQHGGGRDRILQHVRHHQRDAGALLQALALQIGAERGRHLVEVAVADRLVHADERLAVGELRKALFQQLDQRRVLGDVDIGGHAGRILLEPDPLHGISPLVVSAVLVWPGTPCFRQYCECRRRWQAAARYRRISAIWNSSAERQESCLITRLGGPLTSRLVFALGFSGGLRLGRLRRGLVAGRDGLGARLLFGGSGRLGGSIRLGARMPGRGRLGRRLRASLSLGCRVLDAAASGFFAAIFDFLPRFAGVCFSASAATAAIKAAPVLVGPV